MTNKDSQPKPASKDVVVISPPNMISAHFTLDGASHLSVHHFSAKAQEAIKETQVAGQQARSKKVRPAKDFADLFEAARYRAAEGWDGLNASAFRNAMIAACRLVGFKMTLAKLSIFIEADGHDVVDGTPLVRIWSDAPPEQWIAPARNANGSFDLRCRPRWAPYTWKIKLRVRFDGDQFSITDVVNLLSRVGQQVGVGEGRPDSRVSPGLGYGLFIVESTAEAKNAA